MNPTTTTTTTTTTIAAILKLVDLLSLGLQLAPEIKSAYESNRKQIQKMIDEQRDPTQEEWDKLLNDIQSNTEELNA